MTRRTLAVALVAAAAAVLALTPARAQDGYSGGWTDPRTAGHRDGKPLGYLDSARSLTGRVSHPNGITNVAVVQVPNTNDPPPAGCDIQGERAQQTAGGGQTVAFHYDAVFPCNLVYEVRATARAASSGGVTPSTPPPYVMPLLVAVAIPPAPVAQVDAILTVDGDERTVTLEWPASPEPDMWGYVVTRVVEGEEREELGQVDAGSETEFVDDAPKAGTTTSYEVSPVRRGPDDTVSQVAAPPTVVNVTVPGEVEDGGDDGEPSLTSEATGTEQPGAPDPGALSSVGSRGARPPAGPPTTLDTGFTGTLPFDPVEHGDEVAAPPAGDPAVVATFDVESTSPFGDEATMALVAGGLALFVGALVIIYVTRRAATIGY